MVLNSQRWPRVAGANTDDDGADSAQKFDWTLRSNYPLSQFVAYLDVLPVMLSVLAQELSMIYLAGELCWPGKSRVDELPPRFRSENGDRVESGEHS